MTLMRDLLLIQRLQLYKIFITTTQTNHPIQSSTKKLLDMHIDPATGKSDIADKTLETAGYQNKAKKLDGVAGSFGCANMRI